MTSTFDKIISLGPNNLYAGRTTTLGGVTVNSVAKWDGGAGTMTMVDNGVNNPTYGGLALKAGANANEIYVAGSFTEVGSSLSANKIAYHNGTEWSNLGGATVFDNNVTSLALDTEHNLLYAGSHQTTNTQNRVSVWNGTSWSGIAEGTINSYTKMDVDSDGNLYLGYSSTLKRYIYATSTWETLSASIGGTIADVKYSSTDNRLYVVLNISSGSSVKYYDITGDSISALPNLSGYPRAIAFDSNGDTFVACQSPSVYHGSIVRLDENVWTNVYNYQNTSGVLDIEIDGNDNIYCWANAGSLTIGVSPYTNGNWESFSSSSNVSYGGGGGGDTENNPQEIDINDINLGDSVCVKNTPSQEGTVIKLNPLRVKKAFVVKWQNGPMYSSDAMMAYFGDNIANLEKMV